MRQSNRGFALFDVLLAVVLMTVAAAASYTLVKSFRVNSATQQFIRYATTITQSFAPFLDGSAATVSDGVMSSNQLSSSFLTSIGIPTTDQSPDKCSYCYVDSGMYANDEKSLMNFAVSTPDTTDFTLANYFMIGVTANGAQVNQILQSTSSLFSIYCPTSGTALSNSVTSCDLKDKSDAATLYSLYLVFPKSGSTAPTPSETFKPQV